MKKIFEFNSSLLDKSYINVFYGTGKMSLDRMEALERQGIKIDYIGDNDESNWGAVINGKLCLSHDEITKHNKVNIIVGSRNYRSIIQKRRVNHFFYVIPLSLTLRHSTLTVA